MIKIHRHLIESVVQALNDIFFENYHADKVIERTLKHHRQWGARDRKFFAESVYSCVRWWRKYWFLLGEEPRSDRTLLVQIWALSRLSNGQELPNKDSHWPELEGLKLDEERVRQLHGNQENISDHLLAIRESVPDWLFAAGKAELGDRWPEILSSLNFPSSVDLRINPLRKSRHLVKKDLESSGIQTEVIEGLEFGLALKERKNVFITQSYLNGDFEVQDRASQLVAPFLQVEAGHRVIDACAGAGGKSLHLAQLMGNKGKIISMDINEKKLKELRVRATRNKVDIIETKLIESNKVLKRLEKSADRLLLDVPCSGLGVLRRNPDTKWKLIPEKLIELREIQKSLLQDYSPMTKVGGKMVYATCSFFPSENEKQIQIFLKENSAQWHLEEQLIINPDEGRGDGFFAARLLRK